MSAARPVPLGLQFYNLATLQTRREQGQKDPEKQVRREIAGLLSLQPKLLGLAETIGHDLPTIEGYSLIRDRSTPGRANVAAYVQKVPDATWPVRRSWVDLEERWPRRQHGGMHDARSFLVLWIGRTKFVVAHQPPRGTDTLRAQQEGVETITRLMTTTPEHRPVTTVADWNRRKGEAGPGPTTVAVAVDGKVVGRRIDAAVVADVPKVDKVRYIRKAGGVPLLSDHHHAFTCRVHLDPAWLKAKS